MSMLEIKSVRKSFFTYAKPGLQAGIFHRPGARKPTSELKVLQGVSFSLRMLSLWRMSGWSMT